MYHVKSLRIKLCSMVSMYVSSSSVYEVIHILLHIFENTIWKPLKWSEKVLKELISIRNWTVSQWRNVRCISERTISSLSSTEVILNTLSSQAKTCLRGHEQLSACTGAVSSQEQFYHWFCKQMILHFPFCIYFYYLRRV